MKDKCVEGLENFGEGYSKNIADHVLFMLRGINQKWKQSICYYFVRFGIKSIHLKKYFKDSYFDYP